MDLYLLGLYAVELMVNGSEDSINLLSWGTGHGWLLGDMRACTICWSDTVHLALRTSKA